MKVEDLLLISPSDLATKSDAELEIMLTSLIPQSRAAYVGPRTATVMVGDKKVSKSSWAKQEALMNSVLASLQAQQK